MTLRELSLAECKQFWPKQISNHEILKVLGITGGVPKYLEEINPKATAEENIKSLYFTEGGMLVEEFRQIFANTFLRKSDSYIQILQILSTDPKEIGGIQKEMKLDSAGRIAEYLWELELAGFINRDYTWQIKTGADSKLSVYRLKDNYIRFYLKYIQKNLSKTQRGSYAFKALGGLAEWNSVMGLQFENIILNNRKRIHDILNINDNEIVSENPYFQRPTKTQKGCQIDYLIQTRFGTLYVCEINFYSGKIGSSIIEEMDQKIAAITTPKEVSIRPVLIHVNGVTEELAERDYFAQIIDVDELF